MTGLHLHRRHEPTLLSRSGSTLLLPSHCQGRPYSQQTWPARSRIKLTLSNNLISGKPFLPARLSDNTCMLYSSQYMQGI